MAIHKIIIFLVIVITSNQANEPFMQIYQYGQMLYKNPRGIGCNNCHGDHAQGMLIATYKHKATIKKIKTKDIRKIKYEKFIEVFNQSPPSIMPRYRLTNGELQSLYYYITHNE